MSSFHIQEIFEDTRQPSLTRNQNFEWRELRRVFASKLARGLFDLFQRVAEPSECYGQVGFGEHTNILNDLQRAKNAPRDGGKLQTSPRAGCILVGLRSRRAPCQPLQSPCPQGVRNHTATPESASGFPRRRSACRPPGESQRLPRDQALACSCIHATLIQKSKARLQMLLGGDRPGGLSYYPCFSSNSAQRA
jgi:hypothetical protein